MRAARELAGGVLTGCLLALAQLAEKDLARFLLWEGATLAGGLVAWDVIHNSRWGSKGDECGDKPARPLAAIGGALIGLAAIGVVVGVAENAPKSPWGNVWFAIGIALAAAAAFLLAASGGVAIWAWASDKRRMPQEAFWLETVSVYPYFRRVDGVGVVNPRLSFRNAGHLPLDYTMISFTATVCGSPSTLTPDGKLFRITPGGTGEYGLDAGIPLSTDDPDPDLIPVEVEYRVEYRVPAEPVAFQVRHHLTSALHKVLDETPTKYLHAPYVTVEYEGPWVVR